MRLPDAVIDMSPKPPFLRRVLREGVEISVALIRVMVPIIIVVRLLQELGIIDQLAALLGPVMGWVGLPGSMGLVWATAIVTNPYAALPVFFTMLADSPLTVAQVTVLCSMMLIAHSLPIEARITQQAGVRLRAMVTLRLVGALLYGFLLERFYTLTGTLQQPLELAWRPSATDSSWGGWLVGELQGVAAICMVIMVLILALRLLERWGVTGWLNRRLHPLLRGLGIGEQAATITMVGMTLGIAYGGGLLIHEARAGHVSRHDALYSLSLLGLCHGLIEDTLLMMLLGGHLSGIFWGRVLFSVAVIWLLVRVVRRIPSNIADRYLLRTD